MRNDLLAAVVAAVLATALPTPFKSGFEAQADVPRTNSPPVEDATLPEFVPVINFSEFLLAAEEWTATESTVRRDAAEALSARFAPLLDPGVLPRAVVAQNDPAAAMMLGAAAPPDPKPALQVPAQQAPRAQATVPITAPHLSKPRKVSSARRTSPTAHDHTVRRFEPAMGLGAEDIAPSEFTKRSASRSQHKHLVSDNRENERKAAVEKAEVAATPKADYQVGVPGQSMEPLISTCSKPGRSCVLGFLCGC